MKRALITFLLAVSALIVLPVIAQTAVPANIEITGVVESNDGVALIVAGLTVNIDSLDPAVVVTLVPGTNVTVRGQLQNTVVIALEIVVLADDAPEATPDPEATPEPEVTPEVTPSPDDDGDLIIVIEGPVQQVNINVVVIYGFEIELDDDDPRLPTIQIGDILRIEGNWSGTVVVAVTMVFVNIEVYVFEGQVWRDSNRCGNPPPPWAPAHGWRSRCEGGNDGSGRGRGRSGSSS